MKTPWNPQSLMEIERHVKSLDGLDAAALISALDTLYSDGQPIVATAGLSEGNGPDAQPPDGPLAELIGVLASYSVSDGTLHAAASGTLRHVATPYGPVWQVWDANENPLLSFSDRNHDIDVSIVRPDNALPIVYVGIDMC